jgi:hypothetical protein
MIDSDQLINTYINNMFDSMEAIALRYAVTVLSSWDQDR